MTDKTGTAASRKRERRQQRFAERLIERTDWAGGFGSLAQTAERIRRETAAGKVWQPWKAAQS